MTRAQARLVLLVALPLLWAYCSGVTSYPVRGEEARRSLVAVEMVLSGDYVVPHFGGRIYLNKPPLHAWLLIAMSSGDPARIALAARVLGLLSLVGILGCVWVLWRVGRPGRSPLVPLLACATTGMTMQLARTAELDPLLGFCVVASLTCWFVGAQRDDAWLLWFWPQLLVAAGVLAKGPAPLFFYPPVLICLWVDRRAGRPPRSGPIFLLGLAMALLAIAAWLVPYAMRAPLGALGGNLAYEAAIRTPPYHSAFEFALGLVRVPLRAALDSLPWSAAVALFAHPALRERARSLFRGDPLFRMATAVVGWSVAVFALMPGTHGRYLFPAIPFVALLAAFALEAAPGALPRLLRALPRSTPMWLGVVLAWGIALLVGVRLEDLPSPWLAFALGVTAIAGVAYWMRSAAVAGDGIFAFLLVAGLLHGVFHAGVTRPAYAGMDAWSRPLAREIVEHSKPDRPLLAGDLVNHKLLYYVTLGRGRAFEQAVADGEAHDLLLSNRATPPEGATLVLSGYQHDLWRIRARAER